MHKRANILIIASVLLLFVGMIYILFREGGIFTSWLTSLVPIDLPFCGNLIDHSTFVGYISLFVLADSLWYGHCYSSTRCCVATRGTAWGMTFMVMVLPFICELLQLCHIVLDTFDWIDIIFYLLTLITYLLILTNKPCV